MAEALRRQFGKNNAATQALLLFFSLLSSAFRTDQCLTSDLEMLDTPSVSPGIDKGVRSMIEFVFGIANPHMPLLFFIIKHRQLVHTVICLPDDQHDYQPGDVAEIRPVGIFVVPAEILDDLLKLNEKVKRPFVYG